MERSIHEVARIAGTTSRTLRHYDDVGLLPPSSIGDNGYRHYDEAALVRLQRILLLRDLGLGIPAIAQMLSGQRDDLAGLAGHLQNLEEQKERLDRQIASVETTVNKLREGKALMAEEMFDGFDHTVYREEVEERWGASSYAEGDSWWKAKTPQQRAAFQAEHIAIAAAYARAREQGDAPGSDAVQGIVARHVDWLNLSASVTGGPVTPERLRGYGEMYVGDPRFAKNYGGQQGADFVRAAFEHYATAAF